MVRLKGLFPTSSSSAIGSSEIVTGNFSSSKSLLTSEGGICMASVLSTILYTLLVTLARTPFVNLLSFFYCASKGGIYGTRSIVLIWVFIAGCVTLVGGFVGQGPAATPLWLFLLGEFPIDYLPFLILACISCLMSTSGFLFFRLMAWVTRSCLSPLLDGYITYTIGPCV